MQYTQAAVLFEGKTTVFHLDNLADHIQQFHRNGNFYEIRQLLAHRDLIPMHSTVIDVGANVGNHTLFYAGYTQARYVYPIEPHPRCCQMIEMNVMFNTHLRARINLSFLGYAVGALAGTVTPFESNPNNLGASKIFASPSEESAVPLRPLSDLEFEGIVSFLKIDVEGMEIDVLRGADDLIREHRPVIAIEILDSNEKSFWNWAESKKYKIIGLHADYLRFKNYIAIPLPL